MKSISHIPFVSNGVRHNSRADNKQLQGRNSPRSILFHRLFKRSQPESETRRQHQRARVKAMISETGWQFIVTDVESRALIFRSDADTSNTPYQALNRGIGWSRSNLPETPISVSLPRRELCEKLERAA